MIEPAAVTQLAERIRRITDAESSAHALKALLGASQSAVPRAALFLVSQGNVQGWGSIGYPTSVAGAQRSYRVPADRGWLGALVRVADGKLSQRPDGDGDPDFGQAAPADVIGCTLCIDNRPIAVLVGERTSDESPWIPDALSTLARVAQVRLELFLLRRKIDRATAAGGVQEPGQGAEASVPAPAPAPAAAPELDRARRYARLVATDIRLYNEEAVVLGQRNGDLSQRLGEDLGRGKQTFLLRHGELGAVGIQLLQEAYIQVLAGGDPALIPDTALD
jgi:hypothetical protein